MGGSATVPTPFIESISRSQLAVDVEFTVIVWGKNFTPRTKALLRDVNGDIVNVQLDHRGPEELTLTFTPTGDLGNYSLELFHNSSTSSVLWSSSLGQDLIEVAAVLDTDSRYKIYRYMDEEDKRTKKPLRFPKTVDFTVGFEFTKDQGRFEKGRPVRWEYYSKDTDELICEVDFDSWNFHPSIGVPLQRPFKIYFYMEDGVRSTQLVDKTKSFIKRNGKLDMVAIQNEGYKRRCNVIDQLTGDVINSLGVYHVAVDSMDEATAQGTAVVEATVLFNAYVNNGQVQLYKSADNYEATQNPGGSQLIYSLANPATATEAWLEYPYFDHNNTPVAGQTVRQYITQELTDIV